MSEGVTLLDTTGCISSPASADGISPLISPDGAVGVGQVPRPVSRSVAPAKGRGQKTNATCGPSFSGSSASAALTSYLANKCRQLLDTVGSMEYAQTWKEKVTPAGRRYWAHTASGHRTSGRECTGWRSPDSSKRGGAYSDPEKALARVQGGHQTNLEDQAILAGYATPRAEERCQRNSRDNYEALSKQVSGAITTSSPSETGKRGVLNPALSRWLLGYPEAWCLAAIRASRKLTRARRHE